MEEVEKIYLLLLAELDALDFYDLALVLPQTYIDNATSGIEETYYCLGEVELDGFVFEWPPVILKLLVGRFAELAKDTRRLMLEDQPAAHQLFILALRGFCIFFNPIECHLVKKVVRALYQQLLQDKLIQLLSFILGLSATLYFCQLIQQAFEKRFIWRLLISDQPGSSCVQINVDLSLSFEEAVIAGGENQTDYGLKVFEYISSLILIVDLELDVGGPFQQLTDSKDKKRLQCTICVECYDDGKSIFLQTLFQMLDVVGQVQPLGNIGLVILIICCNIGELSQKLDALLIGSVHILQYYTQI